jgi:hypothetical protein
VVSLPKVFVGNQNTVHKKRNLAGFSEDVTLSISTPNISFSSLEIYPGSTLSISNSSLYISNLLHFYQNSTYIVSMSLGTINITGCVEFDQPVSIMILPTNISSPSWRPYYSSCNSGNPACYITYPNGSIFIESAVCNSLQDSNPPQIKSNYGWLIALVIGLITLIIIGAIIYWKRRAQGPCCMPDLKDLPDPPFSVIAISNYAAADENQITLNKGDRYLVNKVDEAKVWFQSTQTNGKLGWFPASYVRLIDIHYE